MTTTENTPAQGKPWEPRIAAFVCRWCTYAGADLAGTSRLKYPPQIRIVKLPCTGRIDPLFILRAFQMGADGVLVSGCHPGDCHYTTGNYFARRRFTMFRELLDYIGLDMERLHFSWVSAAEGAKFVDIVQKVTEAVRSVGPFPGFQTKAGPTGLLRPSPAPEPVGGAAGEPAGLAEMKEDLASGKVRATLGFRAGRRSASLRPFWAGKPDGVRDLLYRRAPATPLATYLVRKLREEPEGVFGIVAGPSDRKAIDRLLAGNQLDPARLKIYPQEGDEPAAGEFPVPGPDRPARERWEFWTGVFETCLRCYACREGCPLCSCVRCVADKTRPRWIDSSPTPAGNWVWNVIRAFHLTGRCLECGACTSACPVGIPLGALNTHMARTAERIFGPAPSPLLAFRPDDPAPFIL